MIDQIARDRFFANQKQKELVKSIDLISETQVEEGKKLQNDIIKGISYIYKKLASIPPLPKLFNIQGHVAITKMPDVFVKNLGELEFRLEKIEEQLKYIKPDPFPTNFVVDNLFELKDYFDSLEKRIANLVLAISKIPPPKIEIPKVIIPKQETQKLDAKEIINAIHELAAQLKNKEVPRITFPKQEVPKLDFGEITDAIRELSDQIVSQSANNNFESFTTSGLAKIERAVRDLYNKPQMVPQPVTNININPLQGVIKTTATTVGTVLTQLPSYGQLFNRRAVILYNNSSNTIYYGGSDVTVSNGMLVLANSYSPIIDAGYNMIVYGIASTSGNDIRVMEVASTSVGGTAIQE